MWHQLEADSPAIDAGVNGGSPTTDQRGIERDSQVDSGAFEVTDNAVVEDQIIGEVGYVKNITHIEQVIQFQNEYDNPVVFVSPLTGNGRDPAIARITEIKGDRFHVFVQEPTLIKQQSHNGKHTSESFSYLVMEAGSWQMADGTVVEVGLREVDTNTVSNVWDTIKFGQDFNSPTVVTTVQTDHNQDLVRLRQRKADQDSIEIALEKEEALRYSNYEAETVGYLAINSNLQGSAKNIDYLTGNTGKVVNHQWYDLDADNYSHLFASINSYYGGDSAGLRQKSDSIMIEEGTSRDNETNHVTEDVAYIGFSNTGDITASLVAQSELLI